MLETDAVQAVAKTSVPIVIIHGEDDRYVPCRMSEQIAEANPEMVKRYTFPAAAHGISYLTDTPRYHEIIKEFAREILK